MARNLNFADQLSKGFTNVILRVKAWTQISNLRIKTLSLKNFYPVIYDVFCEIF